MRVYVFSFTDDAEPCFFLATRAGRPVDARHFSSVEQASEAAERRGFEVGSFMEDEMQLYRYGTE